MTKSFVTSHKQFFMWLTRLEIIQRSECRRTYSDLSLESLEKSIWRDLVAHIGVIAYCVRRIRIYNTTLRNLRASAFHVEKKCISALIPSCKHPRLEFILFFRHRRHIGAFKRVEFSGKTIKRLIPIFYLDYFS